MAKDIKEFCKRWRRKLADSKVGLLEFSNNLNQSTEDGRFTDYFKKSLVELRYGIISESLKYIFNAEMNQTPSGKRINSPESKEGIQLSLLRSNTIEDHTFKIGDKLKSFYRSFGVGEKRFDLANMKITIVGFEVNSGYVVAEARSITKKVNFVIIPDHLQGFEIVS